MKVKEVFEVNIIDDNHLGNGVAKKDNITIFIPKTVKGDIVKIRIDKITKNIAHASVIEYIKKCSDHVKERCPYYDKCGGCDLLHISYEREKKLKEEYIKKLFPNFSNEIISYDRNNYRNKVTLHVNDKKVGFYEKNSNELIQIDSCLLLEDDINKLISKLQKIDLTNIKSFTIKKGDLGLLLSIDGTITNDDLKLLKKDKSIKSIYQNDKLVYGEEYLKISLGDIHYNVNNNSFFQVNSKCAKSLYDMIGSLLEKSNSLLDLYCGTGSIGIYLSEKSKTITGIEINKDSVKCAKKNIIDNNIKNYKIINNDASFIKGEYDSVIVDPPRKGLSKSVISILNEMKIDKIIYVSCNPSTLKRDIDLLTNYDIKNINIFNMFPGTQHIETLVLLKRR